MTYENLSLTVDFLLYGLTLIFLLGAGALALATLQDCAIRVLRIMETNTFQTPALQRQQRAIVVQGCWSNQRSKLKKAG